MKLRVYPTHLAGAVTVPPSKSLLHRHLICQMLAGEFPEITPPCDDVECTMQAVRALQRGDEVINCGMSGSTLRFLLPLAMALGQTGVTFTGDARLLQRPIPADLPMERTDRGLRVTGSLVGGEYRLAADQTSQIISGLMMALPLMDKPSRIILTTDAVSKPYLEMTAAVMKRYGVTVEQQANGWKIPGKQNYKKAPISLEGDWSAAAWYLAVNALQGAEDVTVTNCITPSLQGDSRITEEIRRRPEQWEISQMPDLMPVLALLAALQKGQVTHFTGGSFLRGKESDRLHAAAMNLNALGAQVTEQPDGLTVSGVECLQGGVEVDSFRDHRIVLLTAFAALRCQAPVVISGAEYVEKSYRTFWEDYRRLGGKTEVVEP